MSTYPYPGRKKSCTALLAWSFVSADGSVGMSESTPAAVDEKRPLSRSTSTLDVISSPEAALSGAWKYEYRFTTNVST